MNILKPFCVASFCSLFALSAPAYAEADPGLTAYFAATMGSAQKSIESKPPPTGAKLLDFTIEFTPQLGIGVSQVLGVTIIPEIDFVFTPPPEN
jgi:hypothetical protein